MTWSGHAHGHVTLSEKNIEAPKHITYQDFLPLIQYLNLNLYNAISENLDWKNFDILKNS